jgi:hypothetical protein
LKHVIGLFVEFVVVTNGTNWRSMLVGGRGHHARSMYRSMKKGRWMTVERGDEGGPLALELKSPPSEGISYKMYVEKHVPKYVAWNKAKLEGPRDANLRVEGAFRALKEEGCVLSEWDSTQRTQATTGEFGLLEYASLVISTMLGGLAGPRAATVFTEAAVRSRYAAAGVTFVAEPEAEAEFAPLQPWSAEPMLKHMFLAFGRQTAVVLCSAVGKPHTEHELAALASLSLSSRGVGRDPSIVTHGRSDISGVEYATQLYIEGRGFDWLKSRAAARTRASQELPRLDTHD